jgi:LPXTG-motif cell wall-anchored protein
VIADLRDALDRVARDGTADVHLPGLAAGAVRRRRRRQVRRLALVGAGLVLVALLALTVTPSWSPLPLLPSSGATRVGGHPAHIGWQWPVRDLPARPGPMAGLVNGRGIGVGWWVVRSDGHRYRLSSAVANDSRPALSADGRRLGYVAADGGSFVVADLVTGRRSVLKGVGDPGSSVSTVHGGIELQVQTPAEWSPRGDLLAVNGEAGDKFGVVVIDARRAEAHLVEASGQFAGWLPDSSAFVVVEVQSKEDLNAKPDVGAGTIVITGVRVHVVKVSGGDAAVVDLVNRDAWPSNVAFSQWSWAVSGDGKTLLTAARGTEGFDGLALRRYRISDGREIGAEHRVAHATDTCSVGWVGTHSVSVPFIDEHQRLGRAVVDMRTGVSRPVTVVSRHVANDPSCLEEASLAVAGPVVSGVLLGQSTLTWVLWLGAVALAAVGFFVVRRRRTLGVELRQDVSGDLF